MKKQRNNPVVVHTMPAPRNTRSRAALVPISAQQQSLITELARLDREHVRSYDAAKKGRLLSDWAINPGHINDDIQNALYILRGRSRELYQNNAHVQNYYQLLETHVIGPDGFTLKSRVMKKENGKLVPHVEINDAAEYHFSKFCEHGVCDVTGQHSLQSLLALVTTTAARDGEAILLKHRIAPTKKNPYGVAWQAIATERLDTTYNRAAVPALNVRPRLNAVVMGVEIDDKNRPVAYHFTDAILNNTNRGAAVKRIAVPASDVIHLFAQKHAEQFRGVPWLSAVMKSLHQLQMFEDYTLVAARIGAAKTGFFYKDEPGAVDASQLATGMDENGELVIDAEPGMFQALPPGWKFQAFTPDFPAATFEAFVKSIKRSIANGVRIGYNTLFGDLSDVNYSSIRQDLIASRDMWKNLHKWLIQRALEPIYESFIAEGLKSPLKPFGNGNYQIPAIAIESVMSDYVFHGRSFPQIDPKNDAEAYKMLIEAGVMSNVRFAEIMGEDPYAQMEEQSAFRDFIKEKDLFVSGINDPEANADRQDIKAAADAQAQATELAAKTASDTATKVAEAKDTAATAERAETALEISALKRNLEDVTVLLRDALERKLDKPLPILIAESIAEIVPEIIPVIDAAVEEPETVAEILPGLVIEVLDEVIVDNSTELAAAVISLEATVAEFNAEVVTSDEAETANV